MDNTIKKSIALSIIVGLTAVSVGPVEECWKTQLCGIANPELWHSQERYPVPVRTISLKPTLIGTSTVTTRSLVVEDPNYGLKDG